jgi:enamine deaminase RidA (YjgF/YER057c/UK114 family)
MGDFDWGERKMSEIGAKLEAQGLVLPAPIKLPPGVVLPFSWIRVRGNRAYVSGHIALQPDGAIAQPLGKVGAEVTQEQGYQAARQTGLAILASLQRELGDLDRITAWLRVFGMVNGAPGFDRFPLVINGFTDLILELFGPEKGSHARSAVGMAGLPFSTPVEIEAEVEIQA